MNGDRKKVHRKALVLAFVFLVVAMVVIFVLVAGNAEHNKKEIHGQAAPGDPLIQAVHIEPSGTSTPEPVPTSKYLYSVARGYKFQKQDFVCIDKNPSYLYGPDGLIGIICES